MERLLASFFLRLLWILEALLAPKMASKSHKKWGSKMNEILEPFLRPFGSRQGAVLGGQNPPDSIIPEIPFSKLFPILVREASGKGFWRIWGGRGGFWSILPPLFRTFSPSILQHICIIFVSFCTFSNAEIISFWGLTHALWVPFSNFFIFYFATYLHHVSYFL